MAARDAYFPLIITFIIIDSIAVGLRFKVRNSKGAIGHDDFAMLLSFVCSISNTPLRGHISAYDGVICLSPTN